MKNAFKIFKRDIKRVSKNAIAIIVAIGICIIPAMYAWFNIAANWDPYGSTDGIDVAVANCDDGYEITNNIKMQIGNDIIENLKANDQIGWHFVNKDEALNGTKSGKYYACVIIPNDFSKNIISFLSSDIKTPKIEYYVNEKKNAIAPKITDKCVETIQKQVNETFLGTVSSTVSMLLNTVGNSDENSNALNSLKSTLSNANNDLEILKNGITSLESTVNSLSSLSKNVQELLPNISSVTSQTSSTITNLQTIISDSKTSLITVTQTASNLLNEINNKSENIKLNITELKKLVNENNIAASEKINSIINTVDTITSSEVKISQIIHSISDNIKLPNNIKKQIEKFDENINKHQKLLNDLKNLSNALKNGTFSNNLANDIINGISNMQNEISEFDTAFSTTIKPFIDKNLNSIYSVLGQSAAILDDVSENEDIKNALTSADNAANSTSNSLTSAKTLITLIQTKVSNISNNIDKLSDNEIMNQITDILNNDPSSVGEFISSPTEIEVNSLYPIVNYGSAMTPFYSVLAMWVGAIVLVAILKVEVDEDEKIKNIKPHEAYIGRYLYFMLLSLIQTTIICLGDLFFLGIQCPNPMLFMLSGWIISIVFSNIVYTLTISFGDIGKALAVLLLVLQIAGSGGTFPIEVTPEFFQGLYHFLPFTYAIDAMRETIGGLFQNYYWVCLAKLVAFVPPTLILGLFLRNPLIKFKDFFNEKVKSTHLM